MTEDQDIVLTERELEVLVWISQGFSSQQVAEKLCISKKSVDFHLSNIYQKLGVSSRIQAVMKVLRLGLFPSWPPPSTAEDRSRHSP